MVERDEVEGDRSARYPPAARLTPPATARRRFHVLRDVMQVFYHACRGIGRFYAVKHPVR